MQELRKTKDAYHRQAMLVKTKVVGGRKTVSKKRVQQSQFLGKMQIDGNH